MGLQILSADIPPPARIQGDSAPQSPARDASSRFDGYLNDARSAVETGAPTKAPKAPRQDAEPSTDTGERDTDTAPSADQNEKTTDHASDGATSPNIAIGPELYVPPSDFAGPSEEPSSSPEQQATTIAPNLSAETKGQELSQPASTDSPQPVGTPSQEVKASGQNIEQPLNQDARQAATNENAEQSGRTATKTLPDQLTPVREQVDTPSQQLRKTPDQTSTQSLASDQSRATDQSLATDQSRAREEAVDADQRSSGNPRVAATQRRSIDSPQPNSPKDPFRLTTDLNRTPQKVVRATVPLPKHVTLKAGKGDSAAASFAKFLITATNQAGSASPSDPAALTSTAGIGQVAGNATPAAVAGQAPVADLVADLLAARVDDAAALKGAARVLNASGRSGKFEVTMRLDPPELGQIRLQIQMHQQGLNLRVNAQTHAVAKMIESRLTELKDALALHGIRVDRAEVTVRSAGSTQADTQSSQDNGPSNRGDFNQASAQDQGSSHQGEAMPHRTADQQFGDPKQTGEDLTGEPYQDDPTAPAGLGAGARNAITPATELSVNLVA